jgi:type III secretion system FlhB-like substrate exporter
MNQNPETGPLRVVGLRYEPSEGVPQVVIKASGEFAEEVLRKRRHTFPAAPVVRNVALVDQLYRLPLDGRIGMELFRAVAIVLAHVLSVEDKLKGKSSA